MVMLVSNICRMSESFEVEGGGTSVARSMGSLAVASPIEGGGGGGGGGGGATPEGSTLGCLELALI